MRISRAVTTCAASILAIGALASCRTALVAKRIKTTVPSGQVYFLPRVEHQITLDRQLIKCAVSAPDAELAPEWFKSEGQALSSLQPGVDEKTFVEYAKRFLEDPILKVDKLWAGCPRSTRDGSFIKFGTKGSDIIDKLVECAQHLPADRPTLRVDVIVAQRATVQSHMLADTNHAYVIEYPKMAGKTKKTEYTVEKYGNGTLKSVNATIEDQTADVISGVIAGVAKLAAASGGFALPGAKAQGAVPTPPLSYAEWVVQHQLCKPDVLLTLKKHSDLEAKTKSAATELLALGKSLDENKAVSEKKSQEAMEAKKKLDELPTGDPGRKVLEEVIKKLGEELKSLEEARAKLGQQKAAIDKASGDDLAAIARLREALTISRTQLFPGAGDLNQELQGADEATNAWFNPIGLNDYCVPSPGQPGEFVCDALPRLIPRIVRAWAGAYLPSAPINPLALAAADESKLAYREPAQGLLLVCKQLACINGGTIAATPQDTILATLATFPQFGVLATLPLDNKAFQNNSLSATFSPNGSLEKVTYKSNARAAAAAKSFEASAGSIQAFVEARRGAKKADLERDKGDVEAETALIKAQLERAKAQEELKKALAATNGASE
jgi:hypothetical protein